MIDGEGINRPMTGAERVAKFRDKAQCIDAQLAEARKHVDLKRREEAEKSLVAWIRTYCVGVLIADPPPEPHGVQILREMDEAVGASTPYQILVARGGGKTSYTECCAAYAIATGRRRFAIVVSINAKQAQQILRELTAVFTSEPFATDYPDIAAPIMLLDGHGRRSQRYNGRDTKVRIVTEETMLPTIVDGDGEDERPSRASGACIRAKALKSVRGSKNGTARPDLVILDDLQTREIAENSSRVADVLALIRGDVMGLAGKSKAAIISTATTIAPDDLTIQLAQDKTWKTTKNPAIIAWPDEWAKDGHGLWGKYFRLFDRENDDGEPHTRSGGSIALYRDHRAEMDEGADILNWDNYSSRDGQISGLQKLMDAYHQMGDAAFMAEYQMTPAKFAFSLDIEPKTVLSRISSHARGTVPGGFVFVAASSDLNLSHTVTTTITAFRPDMTAFVLAHFLTPSAISTTLPDGEYSRAVYAKLSDVGRRIAGYGIRGIRWGIDAGGIPFDTVCSFAANAVDVCGVQTVAMVGRASHIFTDAPRSRLRDAINMTVLCGDGAEHARAGSGRKWMLWNSDAYREKVQRALLAEIGSIGSLCLYDGPRDEHAEYARQICKERLLYTKVRGDGRTEYHWRSEDPHDYLDSTAQGFALAASQGIAGSAERVGVCKARHVQKRRRVVIV